MDDPNENLLLRWSRRKHQARQAEAPAAPKPIETAEPEQAATAAPAVEPAETEKPPVPQSDSDAPVDIEDLPDIESLTYDSDFTVFLRDGVPEFIKKQALRKLWASNPILANLDGLNGYDPMNMPFFDQLDGDAGPVAEVGRALRDKIMEDKRARNDQPGGPRSRRVRRRRQPQSARLSEVTEEAAEQSAEPHGPNRKSHDA
jgi:Protein of unknown function (DUF3306)